MSSKLETAMDSTIIANGIMQDIIDVEKMEKTLEYELNSTDLFKIDCAILSHLRETKDFSRDLLEQLEAGKFETIAVRPPKSNDFEKIQQKAITDITVPLEQMFDEMFNYVSEYI